MRKNQTVVVMTILFVAILIAFIALPLTERPRSSKRTDCMNNVRIIGIALLNYEARNGSLPPATVRDEEGRPMHSWRVSILPFMDGENLYKQYDFAEPWNGPSNRKLENLGPEEFACPSESSESKMTSYVALTGVGTPWTGREIDELTEPFPIIVEMASQRWHWMEPGDLDITELKDRAKIDELFGNHRNVIYVGFSDGWVTTLTKEEFHALILRCLDDGTQEPNSKRKLDNANKEFGPLSDAGARDSLIAFSKNQAT